MPQNTTWWFACGESGVTMKEWTGVEAAAGATPRPLPYRPKLAPDGTGWSWQHTNGWQIGSCFALGYHNKHNTGSRHSRVG